MYEPQQLDPRVLFRVLAEHSARANDRTIIVGVRPDATWFVTHAADSEDVQKLAGSLEEADIRLIEIGPGDIEDPPRMLVFVIQDIRERGFRQDGRTEAQVRHDMNVDLGRQIGQRQDNQG